MLNEYIDIDEKGNLRMMADGKVYDKDGSLIVDPVVNFPQHKVNYNGDIDEGTVDASFGRPLHMMVKYVGNEWEAICIITTTIKYTYTKTPRIYKKIFSDMSGFSMENVPYSDGFKFTRTSSGPNGYIAIQVPE